MSLAEAVLVLFLAFVYLAGLVFFAVIEMSAGGNGSFRWWQVVFWPVSIAWAMMRKN